MHCHGFIFFAILSVTILSLAGCGSPPPPPPPQAVAPPPPPEPITINPIGEVEVKAGTSKVIEVQINRAGHAGEGSIEAMAPQGQEGFTVSASPILEDSRTGTITVEVAESVGAGEAMASVPVTVNLDGQSAMDNLTIRVPKIEAPTIVREGDAAVQPGRTCRLPVSIDRHGYPAKAIEIRDASLPGDPATAPPTGTEPTGPAVKIQPSMIAGDAARADLEVTVDPDVPEGEATVPLVGTFMGQPFTTDMKVRVLAYPFRVGSLKAIAIKPGEQLSLPLPVSRTAYTGPIEVAVEGLPAGVSVEPITINAGASEATLTLTAAPDAETRVRSAVIHAIGEHYMIDTPLVVRVEEDGGSSAFVERQSPDVQRFLKLGGIRGRLSAEARQVLAAYHGGTLASGEAVRQGLAWIAARQQADGSWTLQATAGGISGDPNAMAAATPTGDDNAVAATALALLPFLSEGVIHKVNPNEPSDLGNYRPVVERGLAALARNQMRSKDKADGYFGGGGVGHSLATLAMAEAYALSRDDRLKLSVRQGLKCLLANQEQNGAWLDAAGQPADLQTAGWVAAALQACKQAGLGSSGSTTTKAIKFIDSCAAGAGGVPTSRFRSPVEPRVTPAATATGIAIHFWLGKPVPDADLQSGVAYLMENTPPETSATLGPIRGTFMGTEVLRRVGGAEFDLWNHLAREHVVRTQLAIGDDAGSWDPTDSDMGKLSGRLSSTALAILTLQTSYRQLPPMPHEPPADGEADAEAEPAASP